MPVQTRWLIPGRVIFLQALGDVSTYNFDEFVADVDALMLQRTGEIHLVQDLRLLTKPNLNFGNLRKLIHVIRGFNGWYLQFGQAENPVLRFVMATSARILGIRTQPIFVDYESARMFLAEYDPLLELPEKPPLFYSLAELQEHLPPQFIAQLQQEGEL